MNGKTIRHCLEKIGNGDAESGFAFLEALAARLAHARKKHPDFAPDIRVGSLVILDEVYELKDAVREQDAVHIQDEILDVLATAARFYFNEYSKGGANAGD